LTVSLRQNGNGLKALAVVVVLRVAAGNALNVRQTSQFVAQASTS